MGEEGFSGASSLLYHRHSPSAITGVEAVDPPREALRPTIPCSRGTCRRPISSRGPISSPAGRCSSATTASRCAGPRRAVPARCTATRPATSSSTCSPVAPSFESVFGRIEAAAGDYVLIPTSTTHRWIVPDDGTGGAVQALVIEAAGHVSIPARYLTPTGQLREGAPFSERDLRPPDGPLVVEEDGPVPVLVRSRQGWARHCHAHHPFDVVGWDGCAYPFAPVHPRLRTHRGPHPPAPSGPPDVRGPGIRGLQLRAPPVRLRPRVGQGPLPPRQRRLRRGPLLLRVATS